MSRRVFRGVKRLLAEELARGSGVNVLFTAVSGLLVIASGVIAARVLGPGGVGVLAIGFLIAELASIIDNLPTSGFVREYSQKPTADTVATVLATKASLGVGITVALAAGAPFIARVFDVPVAVPLIFAFVPVLSIVSSVSIMAHEARRDMVRRNLPNAVELLVRLILYAVVAAAPILGPATPTTMAYATLGGTVAATLVGLVFIPSLSLKGFSKVKARAYLAFGARTQASSALHKIIFWIDILVIDLVLGHATQGLYRTAYQLMTYLSIAGGTVAVLVFPASANAHAANDHERVRRTLSLGFFYSLGLVIPGAVLLAAFPELILVTLFGAAFGPAAWMLAALALIGLMAGTILVFAAFLPAVNQPGLALRVSVVMVTLNAVLDIALIPTIGVAGAVAATGVTFAVGLALCAYYVRHLGYDLPRFKDVLDVLKGRVPAS